MNNYQCSEACISLAKQSTPLQLEATLNSANIWEVGYGHTGPDVSEGLIIGEDQAMMFLFGDLQTAASYVNSLVTVPLAQNQFDALVDLHFSNDQILASSTLLRLVNLNDFIGAYWQFGMYVYDAGKPCPDLLARRKAEAEMFRSGVIA